MLPPVMPSEMAPDRGSEPRRGAHTPDAVVGGLVAALVVAGSTLLLRSTLQVRSVPERLVEWLLLFVPPSLFEAVLQRLGFDAKHFALYLTTIAIFGLFAWLGCVVLRRGWSPAVIFLVGVSLWLGMMLIITPLTSAGGTSASGYSWRIRSTHVRGAMSATWVSGGVHRVSSIAELWDWVVNARTAITSSC